MPDYSAGTASIRLRADARGFRQEVEAAVARARSTVDVRLNIDTREIEQTKARLRAASPTVDVALRVAGAQARMAQFRQREELQPIHQRVEIDESDLQKFLGKFKGNQSGLGLPGRGAIKIGVVVAAAEATVQLAGLVAEAGQAYKALSLLPAAGFAASAGLAGLVIGGSGVKDTFTSMKAATAASGTAMDTQASNARTLRSAQKQLTDAFRESGRSLRDLNNNYADSALAVEDAGLSVEEAQQRLNETLNDPTADANARKRADLTYREALARLRDEQNQRADLAQDTARENAAGVKGSDQVVAALDAVAAAQQSLTAGDSGTKKLAADLAKLSPSAREFVETAQRLGPTWSDARKQIQQPLFEGLGGVLDRLVQTQLPTLTTGLSGINTEINTGLRASLLYLTSDAAKLDFTTSLKNTQVGFSGLARAAAPFTQAITTLITVGTSFLPQFGDAADSAARKFDNYIVNASKTGQLRDNMQEGITATKQLGDGIGNIGSIIASVFRAAGAEGNQLEKFVGTTQKWADSLKSINGQDSLMSFFSQSRQDFQAWMPLLQGLPTLIKAVLDGVHQWSEILLPFLKAGADLLGNHTELVTAAVTAWLAFKTVGPLLGLAQAAMVRLTAQTALQATAAGTAATATAGVATAGSAGAVTGLARVKAAGAGLVGLFNPYVAGAIAAAGVTLSVVTALNRADQVQKNIQERANASRVANERITDALRTSSGAVNEDVIGVEQQRVEQYIQQLKDVAKEAPGANDYFGNAVAAIGTGSGDRLNALDATAGRAREAANLTAALEKTGRTSKEVAASITGTEDDYTKFFNTLGDGKKPMSDLQQTASDLRMEFQNNQRSALSQISQYYKDLGSGAGGAADQISRLTTAIEGQRRQTNAYDDARLKAAQAQSALTQGITGQTGPNGEPGALPTIAGNGEIDLSTSQGQALQQNIKGLYDGWVQAVAARKLYAEQNHLNSQQESDDARATSDAYLQKARDQLLAANIPLAAVDELFRRENLTTGEFPAKFTADTTDATTKLIALQRLMDERSKGVTIPFLIGTLNGTNQSTNLAPGSAVNGIPIVPGAATGGFLPTTGPGTEREDGIYAVNAAGVAIARVNGGEHVTNTPMSQKYAPELTAINNGTFPKLAAGGVIPGGITPAEQAELGGGSVNTSIWAAVKAQFPDAVLSSGYRAGDPGYHGIKQAVDIGGPSMQRIADWIFAQKSQFAQLIWNANPVLYNVKRNQIGTGVATAEGAAARAIYGEATMAQHGDHVHAAAEQPISAGSGTAATGAALNAGSTSTSSVTYAQAPLPSMATDQQLSVLTGQASVDSANAERNKVYADPASSAADKQAADIKYQQAQNSLQSATTQGQDSDRFTLPGFFSKLGGIVGNGLLSGLGLDQSILAEGNPYNQALTKIADRQALAATGGYSYVPKNNPSLVTNYSTDPSVATGTATAPVSADVAAPAYNPSGGVEQWRSLFSSVLAKIGLPASLVGPGLAQMQTESGGNPKAINLTDSNAAKGTPSKGLMQVIDPTFASYKSSLFPNDIWDPAANIAAGTLYAKGRYGDPASVWGAGHGYDRGGIANGIGMMPKKTLLPERVLSPRQTETFDSMLPLMESINSSSSWTQSAVNSTIQSPVQTSTGGVNHDNSVNLHGTQVMDIDGLMDQLEHRMSMRSLATLGGWTG